MSIIHVNAIKLRVTGSGALIPTIYALDLSTLKVMVPLNMSLDPNDQPTRLTNFVAQKVSLKLETQEIDENFLIEQIKIYIKPIYTEFPNID